ncbi:hypothetical protein GCM10023114_34620 [Mycolicibacterium sediminis]|uniref:Uncharacterized protein n=1 Tax=Mycolicibacterium sediminis TaxID=1286180 RepID=A0A7I7R021_9MYCO|nr:hypothetical protein MSEDJ_55820 [Mycolicibacterium sediminis]
MRVLGGGCCDDDCGATSFGLPSRPDVTVVLLPDAPAGRSGASASSATAAAREPPVDRPDQVDRTRSLDVVAPARPAVAPGAADSDPDVRPDDLVVEDVAPGDAGRPPDVRPCEADLLGAPDRPGEPPDAPFDPAVDAPVGDEAPGDDGSPEGSAEATPVAMATPTPRVTASAPTRPMCLAYPIRSPSIVLDY